MRLHRVMVHKFKKKIWLATKQYFVSFVATKCNHVMCHYSLSFNVRDFKKNHFILRKIEYIVYVYIVNINLHSYRGSVSRHLSQLARSAESIGDGDLVDKRIRSAMAWNLLPAQVWSILL